MQAAVAPCVAGKRRLQRLSDDDDDGLDGVHEFDEGVAVTMMGQSGGLGFAGTACSVEALRLSCADGMDSDGDAHTASALLLAAADSASVDAGDTDLDAQVGVTSSDKTKKKKRKHRRKRHSAAVSDGEGKRSSSSILMKGASWVAKRNARKSAESGVRFDGGSAKVTPIDGELPSAENARGDSTDHDAVVNDGGQMSVASKSSSVGYFTAISNAKQREDSSLVLLRRTLITVALAVVALALITITISKDIVAKSDDAALQTRYAGGRMAAQQVCCRVRLPYCPFIDAAIATLCPHRRHTTGHKC